ncbi:MAG: DUF4384 domain-containing protein [Synechococcaceae cyanobacterium SM2_3_1]|nr:DUF4384 domain-containing protein [Synechococcaceae cyanobacterium SM2_3_1]
MSASAAKPESRLTIAITATAEADLPLPVAEILEDLQDSLLLVPVASHEEADLHVQIQANAIYRFYARGETSALAAFRIPVKKIRALPRKLRYLLEHVAAFRNLLHLQAPTEALKQAVKIEFLQLKTPASRKATAEVAPPLTNDNGEILLKSGDHLAIALTNFTPSPLYCYIVALDPRQQAVSLVYPYQADASARLRPNESVLVGSGPRYFVEMQLPQGISSSADVFKVFVGSSTIQPAVMIMPPLGQRQDPPTDPYGSGSCLDRELRRLLLGLVGNTPLPDFAADPWWSQTQVVRVTA